MASEERLKQILKHFWKFTAFREQQLEIIQSVLSGKDTLALLPTGGGKSLCFQVPAMAMDGICIVISPLIALMKDQVERLVSLGIKAISITSDLTHAQIDSRLDNCIFGDIKFLYLSPERLGSSLVIERLRRMKICLVAVDEAHCISSWGYDFRPSYLKIAVIREICPNAPLLALTATATPQVQDDIQLQLAFKKKHIISRSFLRKNLAYEVFQVEARNEFILSLLAKYGGSVIIYVRTRRQGMDLGNILKAKMLSVTVYHAGLNARQREESQQAWIAGKSRIIVATNAFGMGIDKADVRLVIHLKAPSSPEAYYQEAGRGGRDELPARAIILWNQSDILEGRKQLEQTYPPLEEIRTVYQAIANFFQLATGSGEGKEYDFDMISFCHRFEFKASMVFNCLKVLERNKYISLSEAVLNPATVKLHEPLHDLDDSKLYLDAHSKLIKVLLRNYEGIFVHQVRIREREIARLLDLSDEEVSRQLVQLSGLGILEYNQARDLPRIGFPTARVHTPSLQINKKEMMSRMQSEKEKLDAMHAYLNEAQKCRNKMLLSYFGEQLIKDCGFCDNCKRRKGMGNSVSEIKMLIMGKLGNGPGPLKKLVDELSIELNIMTEKEIIGHIRDLAAQGLLKIEASGEVSRP